MKSNIVQDPSIVLIVESSERVVVNDEVVVVRIVLENRSDINIGGFEEGSIKLFGILPQELQVIPDTVVIDGKNIKNQSINSGINIEVLLKQKEMKIEFSVKVIKGFKNEIKFNIEYTYGYIMNNEKKFKKEYSQFVVLKGEVLDLDIKKTYSKKELCIEDEVVCKIEVKNIGSINVVNLIYKDNIDQRFDLIKGSFSINGNIINECDIQTGIYIGDIAIEETLLIKYRMRLNDKISTYQIFYKGSIEYSYIKSDNLLGNRRIYNFDDKVNIFNVYISNFKQFNIDKILFISKEKPFIKEINKIFVQIKIENSYVIKTLEKRSYEGQNLSGYKLIINGKIFENIEYNSTNDELGMYTENYIYPFGTSIVLSKDFSIGKRIEIIDYVEATNYKVLDNQRFYQNLLITLVAKIYTR